MPQSHSVLLPKHGENEAGGTSWLYLTGVPFDRIGFIKVPHEAGMPDPKMDLVQVARSVGRTSRRTCGECLFNGGGGEAVKHADMSRQLLDV